MKKKVLTLDDLYSFFEQRNQTTVFSAKESGYNIAVQVPAKFELEDSDEDDGFLRTKFKVNHLYENRNKSYISEEAQLEALPSLHYRPVLAAITTLSDGTTDFTSHAMEFDDEGNITYIEQPIGVFVNPEGYHLEYDKEHDKTYVIADAVIYNDYCAPACEIIQRKQGSKTLKPGTYTIECWGGQGGTYSSYIGGYGGYSKGTITLTEATTVYISVGGAGSSSSTAAGFNGGGTGISSGRGGGGATDVRIGQNSLYSRVIVAGGGGGAGVTSANANPCGCGGGEYGGDGYYNDTTGSYTIGQNRCGGSASQTAGGKTWSTSTQATFGQGGNASGYSCGGGGGGWYGGGGAYDSDSDSDGRWGGGGSGYVYTSSTAKNYPNGCLLNSTHYLTNAQTIAGNTFFTSPTGSAETGHTGSGFCRITNLNPTQYGLYVKTNSGWEHIDL